MSEQAMHLLDIHFSRFLAERSGLIGADKDRLQQLVRTLTISLEAGHSCLPVSDDDIRLLETLHLVSDGGQTPLVLHNWQIVSAQVLSLRNKTGQTDQRNGGGDFSSRLQENNSTAYFEDVGSGTDWQKEAAKIALQKALTIICGGPGTGKTTTVVKILATFASDVGT